VSDEDRDYVVRLRPLKKDVPANIRIRRALKTLLRCFGFRCVNVIEVDQELKHGNKSVPEPEK
jgi:hypothetical protein